MTIPLLRLALGSGGRTTSFGLASNRAQRPSTAFKSATVSFHRDVGHRVVRIRRHHNAGQATSPSQAVVYTDGLIADDDWLGVVNAYRAMSGLAPVTERSEWSAGAQLHSCYMLDNGFPTTSNPIGPWLHVEGDVPATEATWLSATPP